MREPNEKVEDATNMRTPIYRSRPVEPNPARLGGERINDFIVMSEGNSNAYLIQTSEGNIQVNAGMFYEAKVHERNFDAFSCDPVRYLILTQGHVDHVGGVAHFRTKHPGLEVIATVANEEHQLYDARLARFRRERSMFAFLEKTMDVLDYLKSVGINEHAQQDRPVPDITFEDRFGLTLGGLELELIAVPGAETNDSLIIWLPQHRICFTGNLFGCPFGHFPNLVTIRGDRYRDALTCAAAVDTVRKLGAEMIIYGHHAPIVGAELIQTELDCLHDAILYVHDETVRGMNEGKDVHSLMREIELPSEFEVGQGYGKVSWSIRAIWEHYAGWFHHRSTTELYSVPRSSIDRDLLDLAGGPASLVDRAKQKVATGRLEEAIHLLDIVLSEYPEQSDALSTAIDAHERLLAASENFWLSSWLRHQLKDLRTRRES
jgi:alkyl sulfatase BDS1-like metallo-beta-lactamase superfamily hydrolase